MWAADCAVGPMAERVREVMGSWHPDVVQAEFHVMGQYLRDARLAGAIAVLTEHEPGTSAANEVARGSCGVARLVLRADAIAWRRFETGMLRHADAVVTYTERDRRFVASLAPGARVVRIPLATRIPPQPLDPIGAEPPSLVFVGNFMHPPNVDAALRLARGILPRIAAREPEVRLYLVGDRVPAAVRRVAAPNVIVTGLVDDVTPYLGRAAVVAVPVRTGGGLRVKVVEALAAGKAIVASRLAVEGLDVAHGEEVLLAEADDEFADAVLALLRDPQRRVAIASKARRWAEENLGWSRTVDDYERLYAELLLESNKRS
jgi:glycosyltransferase involved in cell wall biosynthesis